MAQFARSPSTVSGCFVDGVGELVREYGINRTAKALRLEYGKLKERAGTAGPAKKAVRKVSSAIPRHTRPPVPATFMELITPRPGSVTGAVVELEGPRGRMKIEFKGVGSAEFVLDNPSAFEVAVGQIRVRPRRWGTMN
jgi:hypothetical protein